MAIKNINQDVNRSTYANNFESIFGKPVPSRKTGTYKWDPVGKCMVKIDDTTPQGVRDIIDPLMSGVRTMKSIPIEPKHTEK